MTTLCTLCGRTDGHHTAAGCPWRGFTGLMS